MPDIQGLFHKLELNSAPLAERMRPCTLDDFIGQEEAIGSKTSLGKILREQELLPPSMILCGPPGVGKTSLAKVISEIKRCHLVRLSGVLDGVKELKEAVIEARKKSEEGVRTIALVDEIHRFNKTQQDAFLPHVESGLLRVIGQTTENVSFRIRNALISRMLIVELKLLDNISLEKILIRALEDDVKGLGKQNLTVNDQGRDLLFRFSSGDARRLLNALEWSSVLVKEDKQVTEEIVQKALGLQLKNYDHDGDYHYDCISAFIKSMRGSDPDAALFYMLKALDGGEDPLFITRRMIIFASEDAACDPRALEIAINVDRAVERVGMPEGKIPLAQGVVYLSCCQKSNASYMAMKSIESLLGELADVEIPKKLRNAPTQLMKEQGNSIGYKYPHNYENAYVVEDYLPEALIGQKFFYPSQRGIENTMKQRLEEFEKLKNTEPSKTSKNND